MTKKVFHCEYDGKVKETENGKIFCSECGKKMQEIKDEKLKESLIQTKEYYKKRISIETENKRNKIDIFLLVLIFLLLIINIFNYKNSNEIGDLKKDLLNMEEIITENDKQMRTGMKYFLKTNYKMILKIINLEKNSLEKKLARTKNKKEQKKIKEQIENLEIDYNNNKFFDAESCFEGRCPEN